ncbi:MAG TPA: hypothetical protein IAA94_07295 [Candidatus Galloscillospira stercoripullorum]|nr:hypothetical protein [Candidatus Galloscillospira stercoripullorum]
MAQGRIYFARASEIPRGPRRLCRWGDDATGFINLWGLPDTVQALREQGKL